MNKRKLNQKRHFSEQVRRHVVDEFRAGKYTVKELADLYVCSTKTIYRWIHTYSPADQPQIKVIDMADSPDQKVQALHNRIAELERALGQKQITIDLLEKMVEVAEEEYDLDLKKNCSGRPSPGSGPTVSP